MIHIPVDDDLLAATAEVLERLGMSPERAARILLARLAADPAVAAELATWDLGPRG